MYAAASFVEFKYPTTSLLFIFSTISTNIICPANLQKSFPKPLKIDTMNADQKIAEVERILEYNFNDKLLCAQALQMAAPLSVLSVNGSNRMVDINKRLAILGDAVAAQTLCRVWFATKNQFGTLIRAHRIATRDNTDNLEGTLQTKADWDDIRQSRLSNSALAALGTSLGLGSTIIAAPGLFGPPGEKMMATAMEAVLGAVYLDGGDDAVTRVMVQIELIQPSVMSKNFPFP